LFADGDDDEDADGDEDEDANADADEAGVPPVPACLSSWASRVSATSVSFSVSAVAGSVFKISLACASA
jgi:hypothetical protein